MSGITNMKTGAKSDEISYRAFRQRQVSFAKSCGRAARVIFRTTQDAWTYKNPPDNMVNQCSKYDLHIFNSFKTKTRTPENIDRIYVIPNEEVDGLPRLPLDRLSKYGPKFDLDSLGSRYRFDSMEDLEKRFPF